MRIYSDCYAIAKCMKTGKKDATQEETKIERSNLLCLFLRHALLPIFTYLAINKMNQLTPQEILLYSSISNVLYTIARNNMFALLYLAIPCHGSHYIEVQLLL